MLVLSLIAPDKRTANGPAPVLDKSTVVLHFADGSSGQITVGGVRGGRVLLGFDLPQSVRVLRANAVPFHSCKVSQ